MVSMRKVFSLKVGIILFVLLCLSIGVYRYGGVPLRSAYRKYHWWVNQRNMLEQKIDVLRLQVTQKEYFIKKLMIDRNFREYVSREQSKYLGNNEYIVFFKQNENIK